MATPKEREIAQEARKFYELKQKVVEYYRDNGVPQKMETVLNQMYYDNPADVYGYLSNFFAGLAKIPVITKVKAREVLDSKGLPTLQTDVFCLIRNIETLVATSVSSSFGYLPDGAKLEEKEEEDQFRQESVTAAVELINGEFCKKLTGQDPTKLEDIDSLVTEIVQRLKHEEDERIALEKASEAAEGDSSKLQLDADKVAKKEPLSPKKAPGKDSNRSKTGKATVAPVVPDEPREVFVKGSNSLSALSQVLCVAGAHVQSIEVYQHIAQIRTGEVEKKFKLPLPMTTIMQTGKVGTGKLRCVKDFMIVPSPAMSLTESIKKIAAIYQYVSNSLMSKLGISLRNTSELGALNPPFDKVEQGVDLLQEAMNSLGLAAGTDFTIMLNCAAHEIFDMEKGKYEIGVGQMKGPEDLCDFWVDLVSRYPSINGLIDPLRKQDCEHWSKLCEKLSTKCYIIGEFVYHRPGQLKTEELKTDLRTSGVVFRLEQMNTVSDIIACAKKMEDVSNQIVISACEGETNDPLLIDVAVGLGARFVKIGAPCRGERVSKLNRLIQLEAMLHEADSLEQHREHVYPDLTPPPPVQEDQTEGEDTQTEASH